jgi:hypothetical protein
MTASFQILSNLPFINILLSFLTLYNLCIWNIVIKYLKNQQSLLPIDEHLYYDSAQLYFLKEIIIRIS